MIDISAKDIIPRMAKASGRIKLKKETIKRIKDKDVEKGDVFTIAKIAAINAVKKVPDLIPLCHPIPITNIQIDFKIENEFALFCEKLLLEDTSLPFTYTFSIPEIALNQASIVLPSSSNENEYPLKKLNFSFFSIIALLTFNAEVRGRQGFL